MLFILQAEALNSCRQILTDFSLFYHYFLSVSSSFVAAPALAENIIVTVLSAPAGFLYLPIKEHDVIIKTKYISADLNQKYILLTFSSNLVLVEQKYMKNVMSLQT
ncbi:hypothetical protein CIHG_10490 [Coccidioides immitis H538.4]|uniref:Uncharacterized protein n=1 Tax=Coccidioides immitis H538.4 TaxID=396776 RepID=A0A0J8S753_COCIT|nr:hypothetical protein CIHG_10490 [Coccidioides immitis H538.4]